MFGSKDILIKPMWTENCDLNFFRGINTWIVGAFFNVLLAFNNPGANPDSNNTGAISQFGNAVKESMFNGGYNSGDTTAKAPSVNDTGKSQNSKSPDISNLMNQMSSGSPNPAPKASKAKAKPISTAQSMAEQRMLRERMMKQNQGQQSNHPANQRGPGQFM
jgi:hypothetical protein